MCQPMETTDPSGQNLENTGKEFPHYFYDILFGKIQRFWAVLCLLGNHWIIWCQFVFLKIPKIQDSGDHYLAGLYQPSGGSCSAKIDYLANFLLSLSQVESQRRSEVSKWWLAALQAALSLLLDRSAYFASEENTNVIFFSGTILNIIHCSDNGIKARNLRYDLFYHDSK